MNCDCKDWKENIEKIDAPLMLQAARSGFLIGYGGKQFRFCPWCSKPLNEQGSGVLDGQAPVATAVQTKRESSGLSVGERCAEKFYDIASTPQETIERLAAIINQEVDKKE